MPSTRRLVKQNWGLIAVMVALLVLFGSLLYIFSSRAYAAEVAQAIEREREDLQRVSTAIQGYFHHFTKDLVLLLSLPEVVEIEQEGFSPGDPAADVRELFVRFAATRPEYYQVMFIAASGWEVVRVDRERDGSVMAVPPSELQYKGDRYYFTEVMQLDKGEIYVLPLDFNVEQGVTEVPYVPVLRLAAPLFDSAGGKKGILILNVYAKELLTLLSSEMFIQTEEGYRLSLSPQGEIDFREDTLPLEGESGIMHLEGPKHKLLIYQAIEIHSGRRLMVAEKVDYAPMHALYLRMAMGVIGGLLIGLGLASVATVVHLRRARKLVDVQEAMIYALALLAEERDQETANHLERVRRCSALLARELRQDPRYRHMITKKFIEDLLLAGPLHDIGKVGIPDAVLLKPGSLSDEEWRTMKSHVRIGTQILERAIERHGLKDRYLIMAKNICAYHHERYDGTGYLEGLKGEEIPLEARIFALVDAYDAIRSKRSYKEPLPHEEAVRRIKEAAGWHFDPRVVEAFLRCEEEFRRISKSPYLAQ